MQLLKSLVLLWLLSIQAPACLNVSETGTSIYGGRTSLHRHPAEWLKFSLGATPEDHLKDLIQVRKMYRDEEVTRREITGVRAVCEGRPQDAIRIFTQLETDHPGRYSTAANLGTAYELHGDLELALKWIGEGIRRNPESHEGSEWLHLEILKARMKVKENAHYLDKRHVIGLPESVSATSMIRIDGPEFSGDQVSNALFYQLGERMYFVKPADPVVADLLFTFGVLEAHTEVVESGIELLKMARTYGFKDTALLERTLDRFQWIVRFRMVWQTALILLGILAFIAFLRRGYRKKWFFLSRKDQLEYQRSQGWR